MSPVPAFNAKSDSPLIVLPKVMSPAPVPPVEIDTLPSIMNLFCTSTLASLVVMSPALVMPGPAANRLTAPSELMSPRAVMVMPPAPAFRRTMPKEVAAVETDASTEMP